MCFDTTKMSKDAWDCLQQRLRGSAPTKLLQTECEVTALVWLPPGKHVLFTFPVVCLVQAMARTTANVYLAAVARSEAALALADLKREFGRVQRLSSTDGDGAVAKAERTRMCFFTQ